MIDDLQTEILGKTGNTFLTNMLVLVLISNVVNAPTPAERDKGIEMLTGFFDGYLEKAQPPRTVNEDQIKTALQKHFKL